MNASGRSLARAAAALVALAAAPFASNCSPCDGVVGCTEDPRLGLSGEFVDRQNLGAPPIPGVRVDVVSRSPDVLVDSAATVTSDASGWWAVSLRARRAGTATVDVTVRPPAPYGPYQVTGLQYPVTTTRGQGAEAGRWVSRPFVSYIGRLLDKATGRPIIGAKVTVVRRSGVAITRTIATDTAPTTDSAGTFLYDVTPAAVAPHYVDLLVDRPGLPRATVVDAVVPAEYLWGPPHPTAGSTFTIDSAGNVSGGATAAVRAAAVRAAAARTR